MKNLTMKLLEEIISVIDQMKIRWWEKLFRENKYSLF